MRALWLRSLGGPEALRIEDVPDPCPNAGEVIVAMRSAAVNFPDLLTTEGKYQVRPDLPFAPGKEGAGVVCAVGDGVTRLRVGDPVMVQVEHGTFAEKARAPADDCYRIPAGIDFDTAAAVGIAFQTAHFALVDRARVEPGEVVLVTGASGSVGIAAMQLAKAFGCSVIAGLTTPAKSDDARANGADHILDLSRPDPRASVRDQVLEFTSGRGVDVVIEIVGGDVFAGALRSLAFRGRLVVVGFTGGTIPEVKVNYLLLRNIAVLGLDRSKYRDLTPDWMQRVQDEIFALLLAGKIRMPIQARFPLAEFRRAFDVIRNRAVRGKVVLTMDA